MWLARFEPQEQEVHGMNPIVPQIRELQVLPVARLAARFTELFGKEPRSKNRMFLLRTIAWKLQEHALGGISDRAKDRLGALVALVDLPVRDSPPPRPRAVPRSEAGTPMVGTVLTKRWRNQEIRVQVTDNGFVWNGTPYGSLSAVAKAITGASWSGALFFGLRQRSSSA